MTAEEFRERLRQAGYNTALIWQAHETSANRGALPTVNCYSVYRACDGALLTSVVLREMQGSSFTDVFAFWISEGARVDDDLDYLRKLEAGDGTFAHSPSNCPSDHWNRGDDICGDCGESLNEAGADSAKVGS